MENNNIPLYKILFDDKTEFDGGSDFFNTKWMEIPNKKIIKFFYRLPAGDYLCMGGYHEYFHRIEATMDLSGKEKGKTNIKSVYLYGKKDDKVVIYQIGLEPNINLGLMYKRIVTIEDNEIKNLNSNGWRGKK